MISYSKKVMFYYLMVVKVNITVQTIKKLISLLSFHCNMLHSIAIGTFLYEILPVKPLAESMAVTMMSFNFVGVRSLKFSLFRSQISCSIWGLQRVMLVVSPLISNARVVYPHFLGVSLQ